MASYAKRLLSNSTNGKAIAIGTGSTEIHTAVGTSNDFDEIWIYVVNNSTSILKLQLFWGGTTDPDNVIQQDVMSQAGLFLVAPGILLNGGLTLYGKTTASHSLYVYGFVNRINA